MKRFTIKQMLVATFVIALIVAVLQYLWPDRAFYGTLIGRTCLIAVVISPFAVGLFANKTIRKWKIQTSPLVTCIATDHITAHGFRVGYLYRELPDGNWDSGWRFFSGYESDEFAKHPADIGVHDVKAIANYDPTIIPLLDSPVGSQYVRDARTGQFTELVYFRPRDQAPTTLPCTS